MTARDDDAIIDYALAVWMSGSHDADTIRKEVWYPSTAPGGMSSGGVVTADAWQDLEDDCNGNLMQIVETCLGDMSPAMRSCVERSVGHCAVVRCRPQDVDWMTSEGRAMVLRAALGAGVTR